jgi:hypothetical protein
VELPERIAQAGQLLNSKVPSVSNVDVTFLIESDLGRVIKLSGTMSESTKCSPGISRLRVHLDPRITRVDNVYVSLAVNGNTVRGGQLAKWSSRPEVFRYWRTELMPDLR